MLIRMREKLDVPTLARLIAWMRFIMADRGINQRELAQGLGVDEGHISKLFKGERLPGINVFLALHRKFHVRLEELVYKDPPKVAGRGTGHGG